MPNRTYTTQISQVGQRLDIFCARHLLHYSRSALQKAIKNGLITVNDQIKKPRYLLRENDIVTANIAPPPQKAEPEIAQIKIPEIYNDQDVVVINKPPGIVAHPGIANEVGTVANWFVRHFPASSSVGEDAARPGIVHRLDKDTSGVMILAKNETAYYHLKKQFQKRHAKKQYLALVFGIPKAKEGRITRALSRSKSNPLRRATDSAGKPAITEWRIEEKYGPNYSLLRAFPFTGRTHQIRVHLHFLGHPICGDSLYTFKRQRPPSGVARQMLHAEKLTVTLPSGKRKTFIASLPRDFRKILNQFKKSSAGIPQESDRRLNFRTPSSFQAKTNYIK